jgi:hypothetical protein
MRYDGTRFTVIIPSGLLGSTVGIDLDKDECSGTDKVSKLTFINNKFGVTCTSDSVTPISSATATTLTAGSNATATFNSSSRTLTLGIPAGAKGDTGLQGSPGPSGSPGKNGSDGTDGLTPTIAVNSTIASGSAAVSVASSTPSGTPRYTFTFTLPSIPTGYTERIACFKKDGNISIISSPTACPTASGTPYKILTATP